jgi:raffinose/stachyose/melibiose transport system substrate-binding protein
MNMDVSRRTALALGGTLGLSALLAGCATGAPAGKGGKKTIEYWASFGTNEQKKYGTAVVKAYKGANINFVVKPGSNLVKLEQTALAAGKGPAIIQVDGPSQLTLYNKSGFLADLNPYADKYKWKDTFTPWALETTTMKGKLTALPLSYETFVFYYNPAVLDKLGMKPPKTKDEFEGFCTEAKGHGLIPLGAGNADYQPVTEWHVTMAFNHIAGPEAVYSALTGKTKFTDPVFVDAITQLTGYFKKGWYGGSVDKYFTTTFDQIGTQLADGKAAAVLSGTWEFSSYPTYFTGGKTWDWAPVPSLSDAFPQVIWDLGIGGTASINKNEPNKDATAGFMNYLYVDKKTLFKGVKEANAALPPIKVVESDFLPGTDPRVTRLYSQLSASKSIGYTTYTFYPQKTDNYIFTQIEKVWTGNLSPKDYCQGIQDTFAKELAAGQVPAVPKPGAAL